MRRFLVLFASLAFAGMAHAQFNHLPSDVFLLIDRSGSASNATGGELVLQLQAYADALENPGVAEALERINARVSVMAWAGEDDQALLIDRAPAGGQAALELATLLRALPLSAGGTTAIANAVQYSVEHLASVKDESVCQVVIVATDQFASSGYFVSESQENLELSDKVRARATDLGILIHGFGLEDVSVAEYLSEHIVTPTGRTKFVGRAEDFSNSVAELLQTDFCNLPVS